MKIHFDEASILLGDFRSKKFPTGNFMLKRWIAYFGTFSYGTVTFGNVPQEFCDCMLNMDGLFSKYPLTLRHNLPVHGRLTQNFLRFSISSENKSFFEFLDWNFLPKSLLLPFLACTIFGMYRFRHFLSKMFLFYSSVHFRRSLWWVIEMSHQSSPLELQIRNPDRQFSAWRLMTSHIHGLIHKVWLIFKLNTAWDNGKLDLITVGYLSAMRLCQM